MSAKKRQTGHAAARARRAHRLQLKRALFIISVGAFTGGILLGSILLSGCMVVVHTEDHINVEVNRSAIHAAPKVEVRHDRRHEQAI